VLSVHPGVTHDELRQATGFALQIPPLVPETLGPTEEEFRIMREELSESFPSE
jgi:hypothetical protein